MEASDSEETLPFERTPAETAELIESGAQLIDVRQDYEYDAARIPGAERIGLEAVAENRDAIAKDRPVVFYCRTGARSAMAAQAFVDAGVEATSLAGGITAWIGEDRKIDPEDGYVAEPGEAAAILEARARASAK
ncbi:MAG TPA: rhodanese-like domain-containing protein [Solirubrobacterales bacterium]|nr:rhodanese-like domain-containing protein [Solirubrobacterales bacterium]